MITQPRVPNLPATMIGQATYVLGKIMENLRKRVDTTIVKKNVVWKTVMAKPSYNRSVIFSEDLAALHAHKTWLKLNNPVFVGLRVFDLAKYVMYFWY